MKPGTRRRFGVSHPPGGPGRRALVVRIGALGDVLLTRRLTYSLALAGFRSTLLAPARHASLLLADPWVDTVLDSESPRFAAAFAGSWPEETSFDAALVISDSESLAEAARRAAETVVGIPPWPERDDAPIAQQWAEAARSLCPPFSGPLPRLETRPPEAILTGATLIHPGSGSPKKNWPIERFVELGRRLRTLGHQTAWIRGPAEADFSGAVSGDQVIDRPSLRVLASSLARSRLFIGNDSGVSHLAGAVGAPTVVVFGPTSAAVWRPEGSNVLAVGSGGQALTGIPVETLMAAAEAATGSTPARSR